MKILIALLCIPVLAGCAEHYTWVKPGATNEQFSRDLAKCKLFAQAYTPQYVPQQLPPNYVANTDYSGDFNATRVGNNVYGTNNGTATTTIQAQPNPMNGVNAIAASIGNHNRTTETAQLCLQANGWQKKQ